LLRLAQGRLDGADAMIRRVLGETENPLWRARILGPYVEIVLAVGDVDAARTAAAEFRGIAVELGTPFLRAHAARAQGSVLLAEDLFNAALVELRHAFNEFQALSVRYDAARTRLLIGDACAALGDREAAEMEWRSARSALEALGAHPIPRTTVTADQVPPDGLTQREREVLVLLARGKTNRTIAGDLFISEKTVASHVSHIFTKLGLTSRSAATAYAYEHDLV
jgi:ATP/maltotriose-dependent transcriptional regulator MalT